MGTIERFKREVGGMSSAAWAVVCVCCFVIALGAGLAALTPRSPATLPPVQPGRVDVVPYGVPDRQPSRPSSATAFPKCS